MAVTPSKELIDLLASSPLFSGINPRHLRRLAAIGEEQSLNKNDYVFHQGDTDSTFFLILEGAVRISREVAGLGEEALTVLRPGSVFGEMALIEDSPRSADAIGHESCRLLVIKKQDLEDLLFVNRDLAYEFLWKLVRLLSRRLRETTDKMTFLTFASKFE